MEDTEQQQHETLEQETNPKETQIWSWGAGTDGQLSTGHLQDSHFPQLLSLSLSSSSLGSISLLSCGGAHVIALSSSGKVMTWGRASSGQLGHGDSVVGSCLFPRIVEKLARFNVCHVSAGWNHSGFVSDSGCLFTCGDGSFGQLGHGDNKSYSSPAAVSFFSSKHVKQIACGMRHSVVLLKGNLGDQVYAFGSAKRGQLGYSMEKLKSSSIPQQSLGFEGVEVVNIIANGDHSAALSADGQLFTWGRSFSTNSDISLPRPLSSSSSFKQAALGWNHALLLTGEGELFMLGGTRHGALGEPQKKTHLQGLPDEPNLSKVSGLDGKQVVHIAAGSEHSAVVTENGQIWTWGWGEHGQLGLGGTSDQSYPQLVDLGPEPGTGYLGSTRVYCGSGFTFVLKTDIALSDRYFEEVKY